MDTKLTKSHHHHHHHEIHHQMKSNKLNKIFIIAIVINVLFVALEFLLGMLSNSVSLLSDAGHNLTDIASLILALLAMRLSQMRTNEKYTYGYKKSTILVSLFNAILLVVVVIFILKESIEKIYYPQSVDGNIIAIVAFIGVIVNTITALLFLYDKDKDLNVKGAYLHMAADALVSIGVVVSGVIIYFTGAYVVDFIVGLIIAIIIIISTWKLLKESVQLALDGVPIGIDLKKVKNVICSQENVKEIHHLHVWAMSTTENALTVHIVLNDMSQMYKTKSNIKQAMAEIGIEHVTLEFESEIEHCTNKNN